MGLKWLIAYKHAQHCPSQAYLEQQEGSQGWKIQKASFALFSLELVSFFSGEILQAGN